MLAQQLLVPVLALVGAAAAGSSDSQPTICAQPTATITNQGDAGALAACTSVSGTIVISTEAVGAIDISGPKQIQGDLVAQSNNNLTGLTSSTLESIGGTFNLFNVTDLQSLSFSQLTSVKTILWNAISPLPTLDFTQVVSKASSVTIQDTTLNDLTGIDLDSVDVFDLENNRHLMAFTTKISSITTLTIASNGEQLAVTLPNLIWAGNATFRNTSSVDFPSLQTINGTLSLDGNLFTELSAPNLTSVGTGTAGSFTLAGNKNIQNITLPVLKTIAGANNIANNSALTTISFPALQTVGGAVFFSGNFTTPKLPALKSVLGGFTVESTSQIDCSGFQSEAGPASVIEGKFVCDTTSTPAQLSGSGSSPSSTSGAKPAKSKGAAVSYGVNEAVAGLSVVGGLLQMFL